MYVVVVVVARGEVCSTNLVTVLLILDPHIHIIIPNCIALTTLTKIQQLNLALPPLPSILTLQHLLAPSLRTIYIRKCPCPSDTFPQYDLALPLLALFPCC